MSARLAAVLALPLALVAGDAWAQQQGRGGAPRSVSDVGRRLERGSLPAADGSTSWPLGRVNGRLEQRIDARLDLRLNAVQPVQRNKQSRAIVSQRTASAKDEN